MLADTAEEGAVSAWLFSLCRSAHIIYQNGLKWLRSKGTRSSGSASARQYLTIQSVASLLPLSGDQARHVYSQCLFLCSLLGLEPVSLLACCRFWKLPTAPQAYQLTEQVFDKLSLLWLSAAAAELASAAPCG